MSSDMDEAISNLVNEWENKLIEKTAAAHARSNDAGAYADYIATRVAARAARALANAYDDYIAAAARAIGETK